jgi:hypothetical protein
MSSIAITAATPAARSGAPRTHLKITRRGRIVLAALIAVPMAFGIAAFSVNGGGASADVSGGDVTFRHVTVGSGESLWQIAETIAPDADPRDVIASIVSLNQLDGTLVSPGQSLAIPAQYASGR